MAELGKLTLILAADNARLKRELAESKRLIEGSATQSGKAFQSVFQGVLQGIGQGIANQALASITQALNAIKGAIASSVGEFVTLEGAIQQVGVISQSTGTKDLAAVREEIERLGIVTSKAPVEIAQTTVALSRAGFTAQESAQALEGIIRASEATGESLEVTGDIIAKTVRTFGLAASESEDVADILVSTANNTNTSINGIGESLAYVGSVAAAAGQPLDDIAIAIGLLGDAGIQGSSAGTNLAEALERLKIASAAVDSEYSNLSRGSKNAANAFKVIAAEVRNSDGSMKSILDILPGLQKGLQDLRPEDQAILFKALFGTQGGRAVQTLLNGLEKSGDRVATVTEKVRELRQGTARQSGEDLLVGLPGSLKLIEGSIGTLQAKIGESLAPLLEGLVRFATEVINELIGVEDLFGDLSGAGERFTAALTENPKLVKDVADGIREITGIVGGVLTDTVDVIGQTLRENPDLVKDWATNLTDVAAVLGGVSRTLIAIAGFTSGITGVIDRALLAPVRGFLAVVFSGSDRIKSSIEGIAQTIGGLNPIMAPLAGVIADMVTGGEQLKGIFEGFGLILDGKVSEGLAKVRSSILNIVKGSAEEVGGGVAEGLAGSLQKGFDALKEGAKNVKADVAEAVGVEDIAAPAEEESKGPSSTDAIAEIERETLAKIAAVKQQQAALTISEEEAAAQINAIQQQATKDRIALLNEELKAAESGSEDKLQLQTQLAQEASALADLEIEAATRSRDQVQQLQEDRLNSEIAAVKQQQASGVLSEEEAASRILGIRENALKAKIGLLQREVDASKAAGSERADLERELTGLRGELADTQLQQLKTAQEDALRQIAESNRAAESEIAQSQQRRILIAKQARAAGEIDEQELQDRLLEIQQQGTSDQIGLVQERIAQVANLRTQGVLDEQSALDQQAELQRQLGDLRIQQVDQELQAQEQLRQAAIARLDEELQAQQTAADVQQGQLSLQNDALSSQKSLLDAQAQVQQSIFNLEQQRLQFELASLEATGQTTQAEKVREQIAEAIQAQQLKEIEFKQQQLALQIQQNELQEQQRIISAEIAVTEAEINLQKAIGNDADLAEIANLEAILGLRQQQLSTAQATAENQAKVNDLLREQLKNEERITKERQTQEDKQRERDRRQQRSGGGSGSSVGGGGRDARTIGGYSLDGENITRDRAASQQFRQALEGVGDQRINLLRGALGGAGNNPFFGQRLAANGFGEISNLAEQLQDVSRITVERTIQRASVQNKDVIAELRKLGDRMAASAGGDTYNVSTYDPVGDLQGALGTVTRSRRRSMGL